MSKPVLVDAQGRPLSSATAHEGANRESRELASWTPGHYSADGELLPEMETLRNRTRDLIRNNGVASGAVQTHVDEVIGSGLLLNAKPDRRALGLKGDDRADEMDELEDEMEAKFDAWAEDICCYADASRRSRFSGLMAQAYRTYLSSFEILATGEWLRRPGYPFRTAVQMIDPARLSNPPGRSNDDSIREGVEMGPMGEPVAYQIASHIEGDFYQGIRTPTRTWKRVPRETSWGRQLVIHIYDNEQPGQSRGKNGLASVLLKHKMVDRWERVALEAAAFNAMYAAYIQSALDWPAVAQAIGAGPENDPTLAYMANRADFHRESYVQFNGLKVPHLFPGEELKHMAPQHPTAAFNSFEEASLRHLAAGWNLTYEQISRDYSKTNYSSARAALLGAWRFFSNKQYLVGGWYATQVYALWLEEALERGAQGDPQGIVLPAGMPDFYEAKTAWCGCEWIGPGRGHIDPMKEWNANKLKYSMRLTTLEQLASEDGMRWRTLVDQHVQERRYAAKRGLDLSSLDSPSPAAPGQEKEEKEKDDDDAGGDERRAQPKEVVA